MKVSLAMMGFTLLAGATASHAADVAGGSTVPSAAAPAGGAGTAQRCASLAELMNGKWPDPMAQVLESVWRPAGSKVKTMMGPPSSLPEHWA